VRFSLGRPTEADHLLDRDPTRARHGARWLASGSLLAVPRRTTLLAVYTAAIIAAGAAALAFGTLLLLAVPGAQMRSALGIAGVAEPWSGAAGLAAWTAFALLGGMRIVRDPGGHTTLSLHLPFIAAAMTLGGPLAGAWVAALGTFDRRELREAPWYGIAFNHASLLLAAVVGGLVLEAVIAASEALGAGDGLVVLLIAGLAGTPVMAIISALLAALVIVLRDGLAPHDVAALLDDSFRQTAVAETLLGWLFVVVWLAVGWWAPIVCTVLVLSLWRAAADANRVDHDELTGVLSRSAFALRARQAADRASQGIDGAAYLFLDLDNFKSVNDGPRSHLVGDEVLAELGARLRHSIRVTDAVGRRGGDEFMVLLNGVHDEDEAMALAARVLEAISVPFDTSDGPKQIGVSIGVALAAPGGHELEPDLRERADTAMYAAKAEGGGIRAWRRSTAA
jgi:diguanylate cyclase (GGDEF)-like protein